MKYINVFSIILFAGSALFLNSCNSKGGLTEAPEAQDEGAVKLVKSEPVEDNEFVLAVADGGMLEVKLAELAKNTSSTPDVKAFAESMTKDHGKANTELKEVAAKKNITIPAELSAKSQQKYKDLSAKKGKEFDMAYAEAMVADHKETISKFKTEANSGKDADLKKWAAAKIPVLEHHLTMAEKLVTTVKK